jgi:hypothetical protein
MLSQINHNRKISENQDTTSRIKNQAIIALQVFALIFSLRIPSPARTPDKQAVQAQTRHRTPPWGGHKNHRRRQVLIAPMNILSGREFLNEK